MLKHDQTNAHYRDQSVRQPFDDLEDLYIGQIVEAKGTITIDATRFPATIWGEILLYGHIEGDAFVVERLRRVALYGSLTDPPDGDPIRVFSLAGPLNEVKMKPGPVGTANNVHLTLHYDALSAKLPPRIKGEHVMYPQLEQIAAGLTWVQIGSPEKTTVQLEINLSATELIDKKLGIIEAVLLGPIVIPFHLAGTGTDHVVTHHSLSPNNCQAPPSGICEPTIRRRLRLKFINFSRALDAESICQTQLDEVCEVWRNKAALRMDLTLSPSIVEGTPTQKNVLSRLDPFQEYGLRLEKDITNKLYTTGTEVEIFVIDEFVVDHGGAYTYDAGQAIAFIILELGYAVPPPKAHLSTARTNPCLLAHELGHVLGLAHPDGTFGDLPSSAGSVMEVGNPNPDSNTLYNCRIFTDKPPNLPHNSIVNADLDNQGNPIPDCFRPDPVDHFIRDDPTDVGNVSSTPPSGDFWSKSNVWNRHSSTDGGPYSTTSGPEHAEPFVCSDPQKKFTNYMWVKLERLTKLSDPVAVDLYLAIPGASTNLVPLKPPTSTSQANHRLDFSPPPTPLAPMTRSLAWSVPAGYTAHSCVFAISYSADVPSPIPNPTTMNFGNVAPLVTGYKYIAQRNLHIQVTTCMNPRSCATTLAWVQMENPFDKAVPARLEIDATQAAHLSGLFLEVDDRIVDKIALGEVSTIQIADFLQPREPKILRFPATLPPGLPNGTELPIHLRFVVDDQVINGYTHIVRVAPLETTVVQVLDTLFSALRDVGVGCKSNQAQDLAEKTKEIVLRERLMTQEPLGCSGLLWRILRRKNEWRSEVGSLSKDVAALAQSLESRDSELECAMIRKQLYKLSEQLLAPQDTPDVVFIEEIRDLADRIQEPAGRLVRRQQSAQKEVTS